MLTITEADLNKIQDALMAAEDAIPDHNAAWLQVMSAQAIIATAKDGKADAALRAAAEHRIMWEFRATDEIEIDDEASASHSDEGSWVSAWIWVRRPTEDEEDEEGSATEA